MVRRGLIIGDYDTAAAGYTMAQLELTVPEVVSKTREIDGLSGVLDYTDSMGGPFFRPRVLTAVFELSAGTCAERQAELDQFVNSCHGRRLRILHPDYPNCFFMGRPNVQIDFNRPAYAQVSLEAVCDPFREELVPTRYAVPVLTKPANIMLGAAVTAQSISTAECYISVSTSVHTTTLKATPSRQNTFGMFRITAEPNTEYFIAGALSGQGTWMASADSLLQHQEPFVTTKDNGYIYITLLCRTADDPVLLKDILIVKTDLVSSFNFGADNVHAHFALSSSSVVPGFVLVGIGKEAKTKISSWQIPAKGVQPVCVWCVDQISDPGYASLSCNRRWI